MPDPKRIKPLEAFAETIFHGKDKEEKIRLNALVDPEFYLNSTEEQKKAFWLTEAQKAFPTPLFGIFNTGSVFNYVDPSFLKDFNYGNILVDLHIPYCLHLPNNYELEVLLSKETGYKALIIPSKIWTQKAQNGTEKSDRADFFADDKVLYFRKNAIVGPKVPLDPSEGWEHNYTGINLQKIKDRNGKFRFTQMYVQFNLAVTKEQLEDRAGFDLVVQQVKETVLKTVNKLIDTYRFVTREEYLTRLGDITMNMVYFIDLNQGVHFSQPNIEVAIMNRSKNELDKIDTMLETGSGPAIYDLLLLDASNSFSTKNYPLAVVQSFQALEIYIENFLINGLVKKGRTEEESMDYISSGDNWRTKVRLKALLKEVTGSSLFEIDSNLWDKWRKGYDEVRNQVVHKGKEATEKEVYDTLEANVQVIETLKKI